LTGQCVWKLSWQAINAGYRSVSWDGRNQAGESVAAGVYFVVLQIDGHKQVIRKVLLIK